MSDGSVEVTDFARVYTKSAAHLPVGADTHYDYVTKRYFFRLDFDRLEKADIGVESALKRLRKNHKVEIVHRVEDATVAKERRYVEAPQDVPDGYKVETGPNGGTYYETNPTNQPTRQLKPSDKIGYDGQPVYAVVADWLTPGDEIAFERGDGTRDVGKVQEVEDGYARVRTGDGELNVQPAPFSTDGDVDSTRKSSPGLTSWDDVPDQFVSTLRKNDVDPVDPELPTVCRKCEGSENRTRMEGAFLCPQCAEKSDADAWEDFDADESDYTLAKASDDVRFQSVGGDPFQTYEQLEAFLSDLSQYAESVVVGDEEWAGGGDDVAIHDRPVFAHGIGMDDAEAVWNDHKENAVALGGPSEVEKNEGGGDGGGDGTLTSSTEGVHNTRYSPDDDDDEKEEDLGIAGEIGKAFDADIYRLYPPEDDDTFPEGSVLGIAVDFPNDNVYTDWNNDVFPDSLEHSHVSIYGSIDDLEQATGNRAEQVVTMDVTDDVQKAADGSWVSYVGPEGGEGWINLQTCEVRYQAKRPGEGMDGYEEDEFHDGWEEFDDDLASLEEGDQVQYEANGDVNTATVSTQNLEETGKVHLDDGFFFDEANPEFTDIVGWSPGENEASDMADEIDFGQFAEGQKVELFNGMEATVSSIPDDQTDYMEVELSDGSEGQVQPWEVEAIISEPEDPVEELEGWLDDTAPSMEDEEEASAEDLIDEIEEETAVDDTDIDGNDDVDPSESTINEEPDAESPSSEGTDTWTQHVGDYDLTTFDEDDFDEWGSLGEFGFPSGVSGAHMDVGALPTHDGSSNKDLVFRRKFGDGALDPETGFRQMVSYTIGEALGGQMPQHHGHATEDGYVVANGVDGEDIGAAPQEYLDAVEEEQWYEQAAVQIILGNNDAHSQNVKVTPDGDVVFHDIDHTAGDISSDFVGQKSFYDNALDRTLGELYKSAKYVVDGDEQEVKQKMLDAAIDLAQKHQNTGANSSDDDFETYAECVEESGDKSDPEGFCASIFFGGTGDDELAQALQKAVGFDAALTNNVQNNIQNLANGNLTW